MQSRVVLALCLSLQTLLPAWCGMRCETAFTATPALSLGRSAWTKAASSSARKIASGLRFPCMSIKDPKAETIRWNVPTGDVEKDFEHIPERPCEVPFIGSQLRNRYFALRHGESEANVAAIISSLPDRGTTIHGLTASGRLQARNSAPHLIEAIGKDELANVIMYSSNFTRARQTAEEAADAIKEIVAGSGHGIDKNSLEQALEVKVIEGLRERWFGELDNTIITNYNLVWPADLKDAQCVQYGVESVEACCVRLKKIILQLEEQHTGKSIVLTSHADTLQILQCYIACVDPRKFSQYRFKNGEVRKLLQDPSSMPAPVPLTYK